MSLIELLVGLAVSLLVIGLLLSAHLQTVKVWSRSEMQMARSRQIEVVTELLASDLSHLVSFPGVASLSTVTMQDATFDEADPGSGQLHFLSAIENQGLTEVCGVSYRCQWDEVSGGYGLYRYVIESDELVNRLAGIQASEEASKLQPSPLYHLNDRHLDGGERIAEYVWNFQPEVLRADGNPLAPGVTIYDGSMPRAIRATFFVAPATPELEQRARNLDRPYWNVPTSHFFHQTFGQTASQAVRQFPLPRGWTPLEPDPDRKPPKKVVP